MTNQPWHFLKPGDIVDIIAPSSTVPTDNLIEYYQQIKNCFSQIGLIARIPENLITIGEDLFSANTLEYRNSHLIDSFTNKVSKAIWAIRGGYGAAKIIPFLDKLAITPEPKLLLGFSDITALHLFVANKWHWSSMHSAVINQLLQNPKLLTELKPLIFGTETQISYHPIPLNDLAKQSQCINGEITGGNLSIVQTSLATSWQINAKDKIIFLEDIGEQGYRIDRMLNQLLQAGVFDSAKAVIFGEITPPKDISPDLCSKAIEHFAKELNLPVLSLPIIGHNLEHNSPLPLGTSCNLSLGEESILTCTTGGIN